MQIPSQKATILDVGVFSYPDDRVPSNMDQQFTEHPETVLTSSQTGLLSGRRKLYIGIALLAVALGYLVVTVFQGAAVFYLTVGELLSGEAEVGKTVRVSGKLVPGSFQREAEGTVARFSLTDGSSAVLALHDGIVPSLFFNEHSDIVLEGHYGSDGVFHTTTTPLVSCPSKYQALAEEQRAAAP